MFDFFNYKKVCEQASYIRYLEQKLFDAQVELSKYQRVNFYPIGINSVMMPTPQQKKKTTKTQKEKIGFIN